MLEVASRAGGTPVAERRPPELSKLSDADLKALREAVESEFLRRSRSRQRGERARGGLLEGQGPRYRNPENPSETWSGRGPQPAWVQTLRSRGVRLDDLLTEDDRPVAAANGKRNSKRPD
jgi:DNA-binding protein H-NS